MRESLNDTFASLGTAMYATGLGSIMNLHARGARDTIRALRELLFFELLECGFFMAPRGLISLSVAVTPQMTQDFVATVRDIVKARPALFCF